MSGYSRQEDAYMIAKDLLANHPDIQAIFAENDPMAVGAANAMAEANRPDVLIIGFNGDQIARDSIKAGFMQATVSQDPYNMGWITAQLADKLIKGEEVIFDDTVNREIFVPVKILTAANLELSEK
jgi:ribose transport system substrate-binding protein